jgi:hypothetical protein
LAGAPARIATCSTATPHIDHRNSRCKPPRPAMRRATQSTILNQTRCPRWAINATRRVNEPTDHIVQGGQYDTELTSGFFVNPRETIRRAHHKATRGECAKSHRKREAYDVSTGLRRQGLYVAERMAQAPNSLSP